MHIDTGFAMFDKGKKMGVTFDDPFICPYCGDHRLDLFTKWCRGDVKIMYKCDNCGFYCPIRHVNDDIFPVYDESIKQFKENFGEDRFAKIIMKK